MKFKKILGVLANISTPLATALGGPLAGSAVKFLADKFTDGDETQIETFIAGASPQDMADLQKAGIEYKEKMLEAGVDLERIAAQDRDSAREMAMKTSLVPQILLAIVFTLGYFGIVYGLLTGVLVLPEGTKELVAALIGVLTAGVIKVLDFFLGSSAGSKAKTDAMRNS